MIEEAAFSDDFTFPTITDNNSFHPLHFPGFTKSSLWYVSSTVSNHRRGHTCNFGSEQKTHKGRSFSSVEGGKRTDDLTRELGFSHYYHANFDGIDDVGFVRDEEKMDMLWEDFNDEPTQHSSDKEVERPKEAFTDSTTPYESNTDASENADLCRLQALKMSKRSSMLAHRRPSLLVILKVLKKLFLIHSSHYKKRHHI